MFETTIILDINKDCKVSFKVKFLHYVCIPRYWFNFTGLGIKEVKKFERILIDHKRKIEKLIVYCYHAAGRYIFILFFHNINEKSPRFN